MNLLKLNRAIFAAAAVLLAAPPAAPAQRELVFVGSGNKNIEAFRFDAATGALNRLGRAATIAHPSFLCVSPNHRFLYSVSEGGDAPASGISAFAIDARAGKLRLLNWRPAGGAGPCCVEMDNSGKNILVANYNSGSFAVFPIAANGALQPMSALIQDHGSSINPARQEGPHAHCLAAGPGSPFVYGCDLGLDKVMIFKLDPVHGALTAAEPAFAQAKPGAGPRHIAFHPNGRLAYVINELACTVTACQRDAASGALREIQTVPTLPEGFTGQNTCAEVAAHPSGKFVYASNRGDDSIVVFGCDAESGRLTFLQREPSGGKTPRHFEIDPTGRYLLAANQEPGTIVVFSIDQAGGRLRPTGVQAASDNPMCVRCIPEKP